MTLNVQQLHEIGQVFDSRPDPALYYPTVASELLRLRLRACLHGAHRLLVLTGESGSGKTLLVRVALQELPRRWVHVAHLSFSTMAGDDLLRAVAHAFGMPAQAAAGRVSPLVWLHARLEIRLRNDEGSLLVIDEAQGLPADALLALHRLSRLRPDGKAPLAVILVGSPGLRARLAVPELQEVIADFNPRFEMGSFDQRESVAFTKERLSRFNGKGDAAPLPAFTPEALEEIHFSSQGVPGRINVLCRELLHLALLHDDDSPIDARRVAAQADQLAFLRSREPAAAPLSPYIVEPPAWVEAPAARRASRVGVALAGLALASVAGAVLLFSPWRVDMPAPAMARQDAPTTELRMAPPAAGLVQPQAPTASEPEPATPMHEAPASAAARSEAAVPVSAPSPRPIAKPPSPECAALLTQLSLGEPLTPEQEHTLETQCR